MEKRWISSIVILLAILMYSCSSVPVTGRKQMMLVSNQEVLTLSLQQYDDFMKSAPVSKDVQNTELVKKVGQRIASAVEKYLSDTGLASEAKSFSWEFNLVESDQVNAFCMPGGKIVVYEGILPITQDETGLAVVMGHEVAHAVAKHANERMSQQVATQYGGQALGAVLSKSAPQTQKIASAAFGLGTKYGILLPYSRKQELEADELGLVFMSMAGYDPRQAPDFWVRMSQGSGEKVSEFTSTHPADQTRANKLKAALPKALEYYKPTAKDNNKTSSSKKGGHKTSSDWSF